jgi:branched-chain amino acid aminotransferase
MQHIEPGHDLKPAVPGHRSRVTAQIGWLPPIAAVVIAQFLIAYVDGFDGWAAAVGVGGAAGVAFAAWWLAVLMTRRASLRREAGVAWVLMTATVVVVLVIAAEGPTAGAVSLAALWTWMLPVALIAVPVRQRARPPRLERFATAIEATDSGIGVRLARRRRRASALAAPPSRGTDRLAAGPVSIPLTMLAVTALYLGTLAGYLGVSMLGRRVLTSAVEAAQFRRTQPPMRRSINIFPPPGLRAPAQPRFTGPPGFVRPDGKITRRSLEFPWAGHTQILNLRREIPRRAADAACRYEADREPEGPVQIHVELLPPDKLKPLYTDSSKLGFGRLFTDHMFTAHFVDGEWRDARVGPYRKFELDPACLVFHYGQEIFEGLKAFIGTDGDIRLFRPEMNIARMQNSARRLCMEPPPADMMLDGIKAAVLADKRWIPGDVGTSLYIRPTLIATDPFLGVQPSKSYLFYVILSPVGAYFAEGFKPVPLYVTRKYTRAATGGIGNAKAGGNYASSLLAGFEAKERGCSQVLWLDSSNHTKVEEVGAMNIFFAMGDKLITPPLDRGTILPGVTRDSIMKLAPTLELGIEEREIEIDEVLNGLRDGTITEIFGAGTAAVISPVGVLKTDDEELHVNNDEVGPIAHKLFDNLTGIQYGRIPDPFGWVQTIGHRD